MSLPPYVQLLQRDFANNRFAYLFEHGNNTAELVRWIQPAIAQKIDLSKIKKESEKFQAPTFKQLECDVLLSVPWRGRRAKAIPLQVYILIEHQSEPDPQMVYRALRYVIQIHDRQQQTWSQRHSKTRDLLFDPVLPIVVYAGTKSWQRLLPIREVVHHANLFGSMIPEIAPHFVNVRDTDPEVLRTRVGFIGWVLWLIQQQQQPLEQFEEILRQVVAAVNPLAAREQARGIRLLWFATYLVYHERLQPEWDRLIAIILASVREEFREEVASMGQRIFDDLRVSPSTRGHVFTTPPMQEQDQGHDFLARSRLPGPQLRQP